MMNYIVYILKTKNNRFYVGQSNNLSRRETEHRLGRYGAKFIKDNNTDFQIAYKETFQDRTSAMKRERQLKKWTRVKKEALINGDLNLLKSL